MINCVYKDASGSCVHPGNRDCCAAEESHKFFLESDRNEEMGEFFLVTKEQIQVLLRKLSQELVVQ